MLRTLFSKLLAVLLGFGLMMTVIFAVIMELSHENYHLELDQRAASTLASRIVAQGAGVAGGVETTETLQDELVRLSTLNSGVDLYVLDAQGKVLASSVTPARVKRDRVDMAPVRQYLAGRTEFPILGVDPSDPSRADVFSVASLPAAWNDGSYLYALVHRPEHQSGAGLIRTGYLLGQGLWIVAGSTLFAVLSSIVIVRLLTRRLARLTAEMEQYSQSGFTELPNLQADLRAEAEDEVGRLGRTFAEMANRIVEQMGELKRMDAMRCELLASISNDLRRPLIAALGHLETLTRQETTLSAEDRRKHLEDAARKTTRMTKLVSKLFELARLEARQVSPQLDVFVLPDVAHDVLQKFSLAATQKGISLRTDMEEHLPLAFGDIGLIERVLDNLVENALRYTASGGTVNVRLAHAKHAITVEVADTGVGIRPEDLPKIFGRRFRGEVHRPSASDNAGFGLAIAKGILELHGSEIRVESMLGVGTRFQFDVRTLARTPEAPGLPLELAAGPVRLRQAKTGANPYPESVTSQTPAPVPSKAL